MERRYLSAHGVAPAGCLALRRSGPGGHAEAAGEGEGPPESRAAGGARGAMASLARGGRAHAVAALPGGRGRVTPPEGPDTGALRRELIAMVDEESRAAREAAGAGGYPPALDIVHRRNARR